MPNKANILDGTFETKKVQDNPRENEQVLEKKKNKITVEAQNCVEPTKLVVFNWAHNLSRR